jgi:MoaA/NifB/PqqE/SkfB family radical SAM enzyme
MSVAYENENETHSVPQALQIALGLHQAGQLDAASDVYRKILAIAPANADANHLLGVAALQKGNLKEARFLIDRACAIQPMSAEFHRNRATLLLAEGDRIGAIEALWASGSLPQAEKLCREHIAATGETKDALLLLARILGDQGRPREADEVLFRLLQILPAPYSDNEAGIASATPSQNPLKYFNYIVEVVGTCNLRCPSCPVGNLGDAGRGRGFMDVDMFQAIIDKIKRESPVKKSNLWLFNWGEPLLHPEIARLITIGREAGLPVVLSSNLNHKFDFREAIKAGPSEIIISASGFTQEVYGRTHKRGNIEVVKENMRKLREYIDEFGVKMSVGVSYHLYRHNLADANMMAAYAKTLGFDFRPVVAFLQPLEKAIQAIEGRLTAEDRDVIDLMLDHPIIGKVLRNDAIANYPDCSLRTNMMTINHDGTVALCCGVYETGNMLGANFLDLSHEQLQGRKYEHEFCRTCFKNGLNNPDVTIKELQDKRDLMMMRINGVGRRAQAANQAG